MMESDHVKLVWCTKAVVRFLWVPENEILLVGAIGQCFFFFGGWGGG
jgi:hypothetical protein